MSDDAMHNFEANQNAGKYKQFHHYNAKRYFAVDAYGWALGLIASCDG